MKQAFLIFAVVAAFSVSAAAQTTAFNFQGRLNDGSSPANGRYDLQFLLYDALVGGNQIGSIVQKPNLQLINGVFSTQLDFGAAAFTGGDRFLEIQLRPTASQNATPNAFVILGARQQLLSAPYSVRSLNATNANNAQTAVNATNSANSSSLGGVAANNYLQKNGDGSQLTNVTAVNSQQLGGVAASQYVQKGGVGTVKAMIYVSRGQVNNINRCYNATLSGSAATTPPCGFTLNHFADGGWNINFGFPIDTSFLSLTTKVQKGRIMADPDYINSGIYWRDPTPNTPNSIDVRTYWSGDEDGTKDSEGFYLILYQGL